MTTTEEEIFALRRTEEFLVVLAAGAEYFGGAFKRIPLPIKDADKRLLRNYPGECQIERAWKP